MNDETRETRLRRLKMRSMRRGIKEMDILLMRYTAERLDELSATELDAYEAMLDENDQDLYQWISQQKPAPSEHATTVADVIRIAANG